ncbi:hypothetical protein TNCV_3177201 [Trichonephila clavipes]|nr:hypothetical protein TNCV_3177201 [Trichonephila clavipes]
MGGQKYDHSPTRKDQEMKKKTPVQCANGLLRICDDSASEGHGFHCAPTRLLALKCRQNRDQSNKRIQEEASQRYLRASELTKTKVVLEARSSSQQEHGGDRATYPPGHQDLNVAAGWPSG